MEREVFTSQGPKDFAIDASDWRAWEGVEGGTWDWSSKVDQYWEGGRWGRSDRDGLRWAGREWARGERKGGVGGGWGPVGA